MITPPMLPHLPGVYFFKNGRGAILYIGKARVLKKRIHSYFQKQRTDWKINALLSETASIDYVITHSEIEALLLEADLIKRYQPKFNVLLKGGLPFLYLRISNDPVPTLSLVRNKTKPGRYFGPFIHKHKARQLLAYLLSTFQLLQCNKTIESGCLDYHLGTCAGTCISSFDKKSYLVRLELAIDALEQNRELFLNTIKKEMKRQTELFAFEKARRLHDYTLSIETIFKTLETRFTSHKYAHEIVIKALKGPSIAYEPIAEKLQTLFALPKPPRSIDCFDISHFQSAALVGSCVRFVDGIPDKQSFRRFKIKTLTIQNDYAALSEIVKRRYKDPTEKPDLVLIDGGKGQRNAILSLLGETPCLSLAKREEIIFSDNHPEGYHLDVATEHGKLLIALRNYAHHFAINYHRSLRSKGRSS